MSIDNISNAASPAYNEDAGLRALRESASRLNRHIQNAQGELGKIAVQYGSMIINYQAELRQINDAIRKLEPIGAACGQASNAEPASPFYYNKY